jgi:hypothetical protein
LVRLLALAAGLLLLACSKPDPAREQLAACHRQLLGSEPHQPADIIEVAEHYAIPQCMDQHGFVFLQSVAECSKRVIDIDNPACYGGSEKL